MFSSCNNNNNNNNISKNNKTLLESISLSNEHYSEATRQLKGYFENKSLEQPAIYAFDYKKMTEFEKKITNFNKIVGINNKKIFVNELKQQLINESDENNFKFICLKIDDNNKIFDSIAKNDLNRILFKKYNNLYFKYQSVF
jgi:hypothetical protein